MKKYKILGHEDAGIYDRCGKQHITVIVVEINGVDQRYGSTCIKHIIRNAKDLLSEAKKLEKIKEKEQSEKEHLERSTRYERAVKKYLSSEFFTTTIHFLFENDIYAKRWGFNSYRDDAIEAFFNKNRKSLKFIDSSLIKNGTKTTRRF